jgi:hypothetical protein
MGLPCRARVASYSHAWSFFLFAFPFFGKPKSPISRAVSMGRRNTKLEVYLQWCQKLKSFASVESDGTLPRLGSD